MEMRCARVRCISPTAHLRLLQRRGPLTHVGVPGRPPGVAELAPPIGRPATAGQPMTGMPSAQGPPKQLIPLEHRNKVGAAHNVRGEASHAVESVGMYGIPWSFLYLFGCGRRRMDC